MIETVIKRDGKKVDYNSDKVYRAIMSAIVDLQGEEDKEIAHEVTVLVEKTLNDSNNGSISVETIQDIVENSLLELGEKEIAKEYILYRDKRNQTRKKRKEKSLLSEDFLSKYKHKPNPFPTELGEFIYYRTYSRWLPEEQRREYWWETVKRAVEYNCSLAPTTQKEAEQLFDAVYNFRNFLAGRTLWTGGTEASKKYPMSNFNCSFQIIDNFKAYEDLFYLLLIGAGVGVRVLPEDVEKLASIRTKVKVKHEYYTPVAKSERAEFSRYEFNDTNTAIRIYIGDSKEAWVQALKIYFEVLTRHEYKTVDEIYFNYDSVRPKGERLKTFGGTASGHQSIKKMFDKLDSVLKKKRAEKAKLSPLDCLDIANIVGENVVSGGVRRTSEVGLFDIDDEEVKTAKNDLYTQENGEWKLNEEISHRQMSNNSIFYEEKPSREQLHWHVQQMRYSGEPGFANAEEARRRRENFEGANPCFTGDMKLLTDEGYKRFDILAEEEERINVVNKNGEVTSGNVWSNGTKDIVEVSFYNRDSIKCTPDHTFMTNEAKEVEAKDMQGKRIMPFLRNSIIHDKDYVAMGFMQGDGNLGRLSSDTHKGIGVNIGEKDEEIKELFNEGNFNTDGVVCYTREYFHQMKELGFSSEKLPNRSLPRTFSLWSEEKKLSFLRGLYSANGSVIGKTGNGRVTLKTTCRDLVDKLKKALQELGYNPYVTVNEQTVVKFSNGEYSCRESYDLNLGQYADKLKFRQEIGFEQEYKNEKLDKFLVKKAPYVKKVEHVGTEEVFDFSEPKTHWGVVEGAVVHNCFEILLDSKGVCNLVSLNVFSFIENGELNREKMMKAQRLNARSAYRMALVDFELPEWDYVNKRDRLIGLSLTGWQDMKNALDLAKEEEAELLRELREVANNSAEEIANEMNDNIPELVTSVKPEGTQTQMPTVSSGLHYSHSPYYIRRVRINADDPLVKVAEDLDWNVKNEVGQEGEDLTTKVIEFPVKAPKGKVKGDVSAIEQLETYKMFMKEYVDHNASITVHVRDHEWEEVEQWLWDNWDDVVGVSFLSYSDNFYDLMPYEEVTKEEYEELAEKMDTFKPALVNKYEKAHQKERELDNDGCEGGVCPVR